MKKNAEISAEADAYNASIDQTPYFKCLFDFYIGALGQDVDGPFVAVHDARCYSDIVCCHNKNSR